jgi:hypothetical protein
MQLLQCADTAAVDLTVVVVATAVVKAVFVVAALSAVTVVLLRLL